MNKGIKRAAASGLTNIEFRRGDLEVLPFPDRSFDAVICFWDILRSGFVWGDPRIVAAGQAQRSPGNHDLGSEGVRASRRKILGSGRPGRS